MALQLHQIDANLLVALDVLLEERHVTRASVRLGVTQSAMSQTLQRLRASLDDPLLVRSGRQLVMTPRAEAMVGPLRSALRALEHALAGPARFDPETARRSFKLAMLDVYAVSLLPRLVEVLSSVGPGSSLDVLPMQMEQLWEQLRDGSVELAIIGPQEVPRDMSSAPLIRERMVSMVRRGHPLLAKKITPKTYVRWPHAVFRITGRGTHIIDERLAALGLERRIVCRLPYFLSAPALVSQSDVIVTMPGSLASSFEAQWPVELFDPPLGPMRYEVRLVWPEFLGADGAQRWLRELVLGIGQTIPGGLKTMTD